MNELEKSNVELEVSLRYLQLQLLKTDKKLDLCLQIIKEFSHFVPSVVKKLDSAMEEIDSKQIGDL